MRGRATRLAAGTLTDAMQVRVLAGTTEIAAATRALAMYGDASVRNMHVQVQCRSAVMTPALVHSL